MRAAALLLCALSVCGGVRAQIEVPFELDDKLQMVLLEVQVNGKQGLFILDTGSKHTVVSHALAGVSNLDLKAAQMAGQGINGEAIGTAVTLKVGRAREQVTVAAMDISGLQKRLGRPVDGLLGQDFLTRFRRVTIDFKARKLILER